MDLQRKLNKEDIEDILSLTPLQEGMLFHYLKTPGSSLYFEQLCLRISGSIDLHIFEQAWNFVIDINEMLRTVFRWEKIKNPTQVILKRQDFKKKFHDFSGKDINEKEKLLKLEKVKEEDKGDKFDLEECPFRVTLCRIFDTQYEMIISNHHILYDGWSNGIILKEFFAAYEQLAQGKKPLKPGKNRFKEFVNLVNNRDQVRQEKFWREYLSGFDKPAALTVKGISSKDISHVKNLKTKLGKETRIKIENFVKENKLTLASLFYSSWGVLLQRYNNYDDVIFGTTVSGRSVKITGIEDIVGLFINTLPLRMQVCAGEKIIALLKRVAEELHIREEYETTPLINIKEYSYLGKNEELFDSLVVIENYPLDIRLRHGNGRGLLTINSYSMSEMTNYDLTVAISLSDEIDINFIYNDELFEKEVAAGISQHFINILQDISENPGKEIGKIEILSRSEKKRLLFDFNHRENDFKTAKTIRQLFVEQVERKPDNLALVGGVGAKHLGLEEDLHAALLQSVQLTYRQLDKESDLLARYLLEKGIAEGQLIGIMVGRSLEMIIGVLGILKTGCGYVPLNHKAPAGRNEYILEECAIELLLTTGSLKEEVEKFRCRGEALQFCSGNECFAPTCVRPFDKSSVGARRAVPTELAYVIFTSGSTGKPKGVPISHANFCALIHWGYHHMKLDARDKVVQNLSYYFDWSVWEIFITLTSGAALYMVQEEIMLDPGNYIDFMNKNGITVLHITPTQFQTLTHTGRELKGMKHLAIGAEKLTLDLVLRAYELVHENCRVYNMYGPTEATIMAAVLDIERGKEDFYKRLASIPIGPPIANTDFYILDKDMNPVPLYVTGEFYLGGDGLSGGYLNNPELTAEKFVTAQAASFKQQARALSVQPRLADHMSHKSYKSYLYKTGDLARWLGDGTVEFVGRSDQQVKIRGFRIEPGEIENQLLQHGEVKEAFVMVRQYENGEKYLCAYIVGARRAVPADLRQFLSRALPDYMIPAYFTALEKMPLNPNGKIDIKSLPEPALTEDRVTYTAPRDELEEKLAEIWSDVLGLNHNTDSSLQPGIDDNFFESGGHSLNAARLLARIHKEFDVGIPLGEIFNIPTIKGLSGYIKQRERRKYPGIKPAKSKEYYPLSPAQKRLYILQQMEENSRVYNMPGIMKVAGKVDREKFAYAFFKLIERHESLRTSFHVVDEEPVQRIHNPEEVEFEVEYYEVESSQNLQFTIQNSKFTIQDSSSTIHNIVDRFIRTFDLAHAPLLRAGLLKLEQEEHILMVDMHHIISDGSSYALFIKEFISLFKGEELPPLPLQYKDYSDWILARRKKEEIKKQESFWLEQFSGTIPILNLPLDYPRPVIQDFTGNRLYFQIDEEESAGLQSLASGENVTLFMVLHAIFTIFCARLSGQDDIVVGSPIVGRKLEDLANIIGMFVNMLVLRTHPEGNKRFVDFLTESAGLVTAAFENQDYQFEQLVEKLSINRDAGRNPLFDVVFSMQNIDTPAIEIPGLKLTPMLYHTGLAKFDLTFECEVLQGGDSTSGNTAPLLQFMVEYSTGMFMQETIERYISYFRQVLKAVLKDSRVIIGEIEIVPDEEKRLLLNNFNDTGAEYPVDKTIHELFDRQVQRTPESTALVYAGEQLTYRQLDEKSNRLAHSLLKQGLQSGNLIGIMVDRSFEMIIGILGILKTGCVYVPLNPRAPVSRNRYIMSECDVKMLLTAENILKQSSHEEEIDYIELHSPVIGDISMIAGLQDGAGLSSYSSEQGGEGRAAEILMKAAAKPVTPDRDREASDAGLPEPDPTGRAYVIFTSGSTGKPKGVAITHANFCPLIHWGYRELGILPGERTIQNLSYYFDWSVWEIFITLTSGASLYMVSKEVLLNPEVCLDFINSNEITILHVTPTQFHYIAALDRKLPTLNYLFIGAEKLNYDLVERSFSLVNEGCRVFNMYGPTEATIISAVLEIDRQAYKEFERLSSIPIGKPVANLRLLILDRNLRLCPINAAGELYITGDGVAGGYLNRSKLTEDSFIENPYTEPVVVGQAAMMYKTGDLARWLPDGNIEFLGRIDYQVKIRGFRIEPGEIENRLLEHEAVQEAVVVDIDTKGGEKYLYAYVVAKYSEHGHGQAAELRQYLSQKLPDYMVPAHFMFLDNIPLNPNGKVDRRALPAPDLTGDFVDYTPPRTRLEEKLVKIWSDVLDIDYNSIGIDSNFFNIGGHSLKATLLITRIHKEFNVKLKLAEIFKLATVRGLAPYIESAVEEEFISISATEKKEYYPLSRAQKRLFIFQQMEIDSISYNVYETMELAGRFEKEKIAEIFKKLIRRHESFRTSFELLAGEPVQRVHRAGDIEFAIEHYDVKGTGDRGPEIGFVRPFDLSTAPLLRCGLVKIEEEKYFLMIDMHHIICDGTSVGIFIRDFLSLYNGEEPPALKIKYRDYVLWSNSREKIIKSKEFIPQELDIEQLELPTDYLRPAVQSFEGSTAGFEIGKEKAVLLFEFAAKEGSTLYMVLFAIFNIFLSKLSGQENITVGSPIAGRQHGDLEGIIGLFINTLVIKSNPSAGKRFTQFLKEVKENSLQAYENQEYQYEELVDRLEISRNSSRNPLFDVMFVLQNMELPELQIPGLKITRNIQENRAAKFDMTLYCEEGKGSLSFTLEYCTKLFKRSTIRKFIKYFKEILFAVLKDPERKIGQIEFISPDEKEEILYDFNDTAVEYPKDRTIYRLFEEQAARTPDNIAVVGMERNVGAKHLLPGQNGNASPLQSVQVYLTYRQLNERANRLARVLRRKGIKANRVVGIMLKRSSALIEAIYAVLKAGGAYLPIDPEYPEQRILSMLENSKAVMLLTKKAILEQRNLPEVHIEVTKIDDIFGIMVKQSQKNLQPLSRSEDLIYIIFTSGSTGVPKGAGVFQRSFVNLVNWFVKDFDLNADDSNLLMTSFSFDLTQKNFYASLILGGVLCIPAGNYFDPGEILREIKEKRVTWINCTPSMFFQMIEFCQGDELKKVENLRYVYLGGEPISMSMFMKWVESEYCNGEIVNTYGPTECTDISNSYRIKEPRRFLEQAVPIGKPIYNVKLYVADKNLQLLPVGIAGELLIAGESVGIGYINDKKLTDKKFVRHSFVKGEARQLLYRTGDLVKWLPDGNIEFISRVDFQIKIRGFRIEIGEIESRLLDHEKIKEAVVIDRKGVGSGERYLCAYFVSDKLTGIQSPTAGELKDYLSQTLPTYMIPSYFIELEEIPLNPNGKVNRKALPMPDIVSEREYTAPRSELEDVLVNIWSEILGIEKGRIGIDDDFFELGGHSLKAAELIAKIHKRLNREVPLREIFRISSVRDLSEYIDRVEKSRYMSIGLVEKKEYYPLSSAQKRLYLSQKTGKDNITYNMPQAMILQGQLEKDRLQETFFRLIARHESFRTSFEMIAGEPVQRIRNYTGIEFKIKYYETGISRDESGIREKQRGSEPDVGAQRAVPLEPAARNLQPEQVMSIIARFIRPFDLAKPPLLRVGLKRLAAEEYILLIDMHHIISDGISMGVLINDFMAIYGGESPSPHWLPRTYKDFSEWQNSNKRRFAIEDQENYWLRQFTGELPIMELPCDYPRPEQRSFEGSALMFEIDLDKTKALKRLAQEEGVTLFMVLLAIYNVLLSKLTWSEDIVVGTPILGRRSTELRQIIGMFVTTLALRNYPGGKKTFKTFLNEIKARTLEAFENQDYPFEQLVEKVVAGRETSHNPLFDTVFTLQNFNIPEVEIPGLKLSPCEYKNPVSRFDLTWIGEEKEEAIVFTIEYSTRLFEEDTIERFVDSFKEIVGIVLPNRDIRLEDIDLSPGFVETERTLYEEASGEFEL